MNELTTNFVAQPAVTPGRDSQITARWLLWQPALIMEARKLPFPTAQLEQYKMTHRSRIIALQSAGIKWRVILRHNLDNPMSSPALFEFQLRSAIERSEARPNKHNVMKRKGNKLRLR